MSRDEIEAVWDDRIALMARLVGCPISGGASRCRSLRGLPATPVAGISTAGAPIRASGS
jgi:hypothetical protein